jgi:glycosyltransferase involved in cell wall biosynthesis
MARILFLVSELGAGGAERQLVNLAKGLDRLGHSVAIACWVPGGVHEGALSGTAVRLEHLLSAPTRAGLRMATLIRAAQRLADAFRPHVVHGYMGPGNLVAGLLRSPEPGARTVWGIRASDQAAYDLFGRIVFQLNRVLCRRADLVIANSTVGAQHVAASGYPASLLKVIHNGIDTGHFRFDALGRERLRHAWGVRDGERVIGMAGRLDPMKGHDTFAAAARLLAARHADVRFVCAGEGRGEHRERTLRVIEQAGLAARFSWLGHVEDMPAFYSALDLATSSSSYGEGFSNAVAEAMACGIPCVATDVGDSAFLVGTAGETVAARDPAALAAAWERQLKRPGARPLAECRERIVRHFSIERLVAETEAAILPPAVPRLAPAV